MLAIQIDNEAVASYFHNNSQEALAVLESIATQKMKLVAVNQQSQVSQIDRLQAVLEEYKSVQPFANIDAAVWQTQARNEW
jgi:hypothetical protein